jgi:hypothetical protein
MAITYLVELPCAVKERFAPRRFLHRLYEHDRANEALNKARLANPAISPEDVSFQVAGRQDGKPVLRETTVARSFARWAELESLSGSCAGCPARISGRAFSCRGEVQLPLSLRGEAFLMSIVRGSEAEPGPQLLLNYFASNGVTGNRPEEMRRLPGVFFESPQPLVRRYQSGARISSNQMFELLFLSGRITQRQSRFLLGLLDLYTPHLTSAAPEELAGLRLFERYDNGLLLARSGLRFPAVVDADRCVRDLREFFAGLLYATELGVSLKVTL